MEPVVPRLASRRDSAQVAAKWRVLAHRGGGKSSGGQRPHVFKSLALPVAKKPKLCYAFLLGGFRPRPETSLWAIEKGAVYS